ncbi:hypothetical protein [Cytobacillus purgationiresistens]|uniref:Uncharacterized protein n=1 Tax=Cytobacillus purgationiresistens TaxID=863449 RepID=A0ABU0ART8_9BACI|nr:hypothetical protein [Cytobacillus purgationiresistens]MDQ0273138.1 hypothetical protein [Cytobacillus purgationiresistens]
MTLRRAFPYVLLTIFLSFLVIQYPGDSSRTSQTSDHQQAVLNANLSSDGFHYQDDLKKHPLLLPAGSTILMNIALMVISLCQLTFFVIRNGKFYHPVFYQSNYLDSTP